MPRDEVDEALEDAQREYHYAQQDFNRNSSAPMPKDGKVARYYRFADDDGDTTYDIVWCDRVTGERVTRYDGADPANTNPYYGATPDKVIFEKKGRDITEMVDPSDVKFTDDALREKWKECEWRGSDWDDRDDDWDD